ncbi:SIMPL domain-containing protein [Aurantiacibacter spongiae]|uniref:SIMPL domain-containing protein n=1 Tax=Aurantiacibacter spongiae TaxID=2488860 RepID=UPI0013152B31|nr:SIMPL domain-containing protein [Aurantiacibacter spongiae]
MQTDAFEAEDGWFRHDGREVGAGRAAGKERLRSAERYPPRAMIGASQSEIIAMLRYALALSATALVTAPAGAEVRIETNGPVIALGVTQTVSLDPDIANLGAGVTTLAPTAVEAMRQNAASMNRVIDRIEALGIDEDDIQTSGISLNPEYQYNQQTSQQDFRGYRVTNRVMVKLRDIDKTGEVLDALVSVGANDIGGIGWEAEDTDAAVEQARQAAMRTGRERALNYARAAGYSDIRLLEISENVSPGRPMPYQDAPIVATAARAESTPVRPGQVQAGVTVNLTWEMVQ